MKQTMKKSVIASVLVAFFILFSGCVVNINEANEATDEEWATPSEAEAFLQTVFTDKEDFAQRVIDAHKEFNKTNKQSDERLECLTFYMDFVKIPEGAIFEHGEVDWYGDKVYLFYLLGEEEFSIRFLNAREAPNPYFYENYELHAGKRDKLEYHDYKGRRILEINSSGADYVMFAQRYGDYEVVVDVSKQLLIKKGWEAFAEIAKVEIDFKDIKPANISTFPPPTAMPTHDPNEEPTAAPYNDDMIH